MHSFSKVYKAMAANFQTIAGHEWFLSIEFPLSHTTSHSNYPELIFSGAMSRNEAIALLILSSLKSAREYVESHGNFAAVFTYEEILADEDEMSRLFGLFGGELVDKYWAKADSQDNTVISQENLKKIEAETFKISEDLMSFLNVPRIDSSLNDFKKFIELGSVTG